MKASLITTVGTVLFCFVIMLIWPDKTISPGQLSSGHQDLNGECFQCHTLVLGPTQEKCQTCHKLAEIGKLTVAGQPRAASEINIVFHSALADNDCMTCHVGHASQPMETKFKHELLTTAAQSNCLSCHAKPDDTLHRPLEAKCDSCHTNTAWKPATFNHSQFTSAANSCTDCHAKDKPQDEIHGQVTQYLCKDCHTTTAWKPTTFNHNQYFVPDENHPLSNCTTCHPTTLKEYSCYGCHEHTPANIENKHLEEGINNFKNCVECHTSSNKEGGEGGGENERGDDNEGDDD
jgi:hypothetical protein